MTSEPDMKFEMKHPSITTYLIVEVRGTCWVASTPGGGYLMRGYASANREDIKKDVFFAVRRYLS